MVLAGACTATSPDTVHTSSNIARLAAAAAATAAVTASGRHHRHIIAARACSSSPLAAITCALLSYHFCDISKQPASRCELHIHGLLQCVKCALTTVSRLTLCAKKEQGRRKNSFNALRLLLEVHCIQYYRSDEHVYQYGTARCSM
jgi:hypothetical protein